MDIVQIGSLCFGLVIGWITYRTLRRTDEAVALSNIATVIGAVGGAAVTGIFKNEMVFATYCIGLAIGFYLDRYFQTKPWLTIIFLLLGVAAGFRSLSSLAKEIDKRERKK